jgi:hypothetical protein
MNFQTFSSAIQEYIEHTGGEITLTYTTSLYLLLKI